MNLGPEVRRLYDTLFCVGRTPDAPCRKLASAIATYRKRYLTPMRRWLSAHRPAALPDTLLYPFSGGDLLSALSAFPGARRLVHLSLEHGGPPDPLRGRSPAGIREAHFKLYFMADLLLTHGESFSVDLQKQEQAVLPGVLPLLLVGLRAHGGVPTGLAYLRIGPDGSLAPYSRAELSAAAPRARRLYTTWKDPRYSMRFSHLELRFRLPGDTADRRVIHLSANLANPGLRRHPGVGKVIQRLGRVALMLKAASYLLWTDGFSRARSLLFGAARFGISDLTAPYPDWLRKHGFSVEAHGRYDCMKKPKLRGAALPWVQLFRKPASRRLPFRWGYVDCHGQNHIVLIRRRPSAP